MTNDELNAADALALSLPDGETKRALLDLVSEVRRLKSGGWIPDYSDTGEGFHPFKTEDENW